MNCLMYYKSKRMKLATDVINRTQVIRSILPKGTSYKCCNLIPFTSILNNLIKTGKRNNRKCVLNSYNIGIKTLNDFRNLLAECC